ncbi:hypothetical protein ACFQH3_06780 [Haladaptatus sp. GCM10025707]|nr:MULTISPECIES: hypothetical protein [unclassified Haladaptatus]
MSNDSLKQYLAEHPRMVGVLFTLMLLLFQAGNVIAGGGGPGTGP